MSMYTELAIVDGVARTYLQGSRPVAVLDAVNLLLGQGQTVALLGRSGSGKTTLLNLLAGIDRPDSGRITVAGVEVSALREPECTLFRRQHIGFVYQNFHLLPGLSAAENVALALQLQGIPVSEALARAKACLEALGLGILADQFPTRLSGGEQQRVAIARALVHRPALVLADEPTGSLDAQSGAAVLEWMRERLREQGGTCLLVTHSLAVARSADRILTLEAGRIEERHGDFAW